MFAATVLFGSAEVLTLIGVAWRVAQLRNERRYVLLLAVLEILIGSCTATTALI